MRKIYLAAAAALLTLSACNDSNKDRDRDRDRDRDQAESSERDTDRDRDRDRGGRDDEERDRREEPSDADADSPSDSGLAGQVRNQVASACQASSRTANIPNIDVGRLCECVAERASTGRSEEELRTILGGGPAARAMGEQVGRECAMQQLGGATK